jgi:hypothetical protein
VSRCSRTGIVGCVEREAPLSAFNLYWRVAGLPLSRLRGYFVDRLPISLVELLLWVGGVSTLVWGLSWMRYRGVRVAPRARWILFLLGPVLLVTLGTGQGATSFSLDPTAWRAPLVQEFGADSLSQEEFNAWARDREQRLRREFDWEALQSLTEAEMLATSNRSIDSVFVDLGLPPGRTVRAVKAMGPLTTVIGLAYGGPAFHDPLTGEVGLVRSRDYPARRDWRLVSLCHESIHAKGIFREMDTAILTQLSLDRAPDPRFRMLGDLHFLQKTGLKVQWPDSIQSEIRRTRAARLETERHQPVIRWLRDWARRGHLQNSVKKYGVRTRREPWNPRHPFFATLHRIQARVKGVPRDP